MNKITKYKVDHEQFLRPNTPEIAYVLGLLWADGHVTHPLKRKRGRNAVTLTSSYPDSESYTQIFEKTGGWNIYKYENKIPTRKPVVFIRTSNPYIYNFLVEHDYSEKSMKSPLKILSIIPEHLKPYFFLGWVDGDGCFFFKEEGYKAKCFFMAGSVDQDWSALIELCQKLDIDYKIVKEQSKSGNSSDLSIGKGESLIKFGNYIYPKGSFGLLRKFTKFQEIKKTFIPKTSKYKGICFEQSSNRWQAFGPQGKKVKKNKFCKRFKTEKDAVLALRDLYRKMDLPDPNAGTF